ncbi:DedA family protein [Actinomadura craniellae]|uniref:DedA family protein n=1 Tax=Actinomadura craniellae TaxID=2231787 RepID=A0A365GWX9_9ACTN|nr:DedA family protein [Actinomadura craniellae]RAY11337.1 DedA family protein [Actinomadura craniellae]
MIASGQTSQQDLSGIAGWAASVIETMGAFGVGLLIALENLFPPVPSELILPLAGFTASQGQVNVIAVIVAATAGSLAGALLLYWLGAALGHDRAIRWADRVPLVDPRDLERATAWFEDHGRKAVLFGRLIPVVRSFISIPAGTERMPLGRFCLYTVVGSAVWNTLFVTIGYVLGEKWQQAEKFANWLTWGVLALLVLAVVRFAVRKLRESRPSSHA